MSDLLSGLRDMANNATLHANTRRALDRYADAWEAERKQAEADRQQWAEKREALSRAALAARAEERQHWVKNWTLLLREISKLDTRADWGGADDDTLLEQFDPWDTLRSLEDQPDDDLSRRRCGKAR